MDNDRLDEKARQVFSLAGPPVDTDSFCEAVLAREAGNGGKSGSRLRAKSRRRKVWRRVASCDSSDRGGDCRNSWGSPLSQSCGSGVLWIRLSKRRHAIRLPS